MTDEKIEFVNDKLFVYTPLPQYGAEIYEAQLVMTKEIFQECYKKWIESQEISDHNLKMWHDMEVEATLDDKICENCKYEEVEFDSSPCPMCDANHSEFERSE